MSSPSRGASCADSGRARKRPPGVGPRTWLARSRTEDGLWFENAVDPVEVNSVRDRPFWGAEPLAGEVPASIFTDGFESGETSAWSSFP